MAMIHDCPSCGRTTRSLGNDPQLCLSCKLKDEVRQSFLFCNTIKKGKMDDKLTELLTDSDYRIREAALDRVNTLQKGKKSWTTQVFAGLLKRLRIS